VLSYADALVAAKPTLAPAVTTFSSERLDRLLGLPKLPPLASSETLVDTLRRRRGLAVGGVTALDVLQEDGGRPFNMPPPFVKTRGAFDASTVASSGVSKKPEAVPLFPRARPDKVARAVAAARKRVSEARLARDAENARSRDLRPYATTAAGGGLALGGASVTIRRPASKKDMLPPPSLESSQSLPFVSHSAYLADAPPREVS